MCGIVGAIAQRDVAEILLEGLRRLEYRGYDSAGLAVVDAEGHMTRLRRLGKVQMLAQAAEEHPLHGGTGIAHTRWATHGEPSEVNAHPHVSEHIVVVHNGIIENHEPLREELKARGYTFVSETDTEVIAHLVNWELKQGGTLREAVLRAIPQLRGAYGTVIMDSRHPDTLLAARSGSPLVIGLGMGENFIASDQLALLPVTRRFIFLEEGDIAEITRRSVNIFDVIKNSVIGDDCEISPYTVVEDANLAAACTIGPFARLRPGAELLEGAHVGNFVEMKKARLGKGSKAGHLTYLGDAEIGDNVNIGAGTITCNYDGANKFKTIIGDDVFVGSDTQLVAPVTVGKGATIAAGTTVTRNVGENALAISRVPQTQKEGWRRPVKKK